MKNKINLTSGVLVNGKTIKELTYDAEEITPDQYAQADKLRAVKMKSNNKADISLNLAEFDYTFHFYLGCMAIIAVNPEIDILDLERLKGSDIFKVGSIGRSFLLQSAAASGNEISAELSETTAEPTTPEVLRLDDGL